MLALTTGQAARYCLVSADTIARWIASGRLPAQRTAGGQYRIHCHDLRAFMVAHQMRVDVLDCDTGHSLACWEFFSAERKRIAPECAQCPVKRSGAAACHELRPLLGTTPSAASCAECEYLAACKDLMEE